MRRTKPQRQEEILPILKKLKELRLTPVESPEIKAFYSKMQTYIQDGTRQEILIPFITMNVRLVGVLAADDNERTWVKLEHIKDLE